MKNINALNELKSILQNSKSSIEEASKKDAEFREDVLKRLEDIENFLYEKFDYKL